MNKDKKAFWETIKVLDKNEVLEQLSFLANQAALPKEGQKKSIIAPILSTIRRGIENIPKLLTLFEALRGVF